MSKHTHTPGPWQQHDLEYCPLEIFGDLEGPMENGRVRGTQVCEIIQSNCQEQDEANAKLIAAAPELLNALLYLNHMGGDDRGGYCICPKNDGIAPDAKHATSCADARKAIRKAGFVGEVDPAKSPRIKPVDKVRCGSCGGRGYVPGDPDLGERESRQCRDCNGVGAI